MRRIGMVVRARDRRFMIRSCRCQIGKIDCRWHYAPAGDQNLRHVRDLIDEFGAMSDLSLDQGALLGHAISNSTNVLMIFSASIRRVSNLTTPRDDYISLSPSPLSKISATRPPEA